MAITPSDLQPTDKIITIKGNKYTCKPPKLSHRLIIAKMQPFFQSFENLAKGEPVDYTRDQIIEFQADIDYVITDLIPELSNVTLEPMDVLEIFMEILEMATPDEIKELQDNKVKGAADPKAKTIG